MRIGVLKPNWSFISGHKSMHLWAEAFITKYCEKELTYEECKIYNGDVIIQVNGRPDLLENCPPKEFKGLKIVHLFDHVFQVKNTLKALYENEIEYVMCYNRHDIHDEFFKFHFKDWINKVISVPFGYNSIRFKEYIPISERKKKCVAVGSVNPVADPLCQSDIQEYMDFHCGKELFTHKWRRMLVENEGILENEINSLLPKYPRTKNFDYDIVKAYNDYMMFTSCESIMNYPSVKTFEGMACGTALVCSNHECYIALGLVSGRNCIMHKQNDIENFKQAVNYYQNDLEKLKDIAIAGKEFVETYYSSERIASTLFDDIKNIWQTT